jgi:hypothetical protein
MEETDYPSLKGAGFSPYIRDSRLAIELSSRPKRSEVESLP